jgi:hypothetical protein
MTTNYRKETETRLACFIFGIGFDLYYNVMGKWIWCETVETEGEAERWTGLGK